MGCSFSAIDDDEHEWELLKERRCIQVVKWGPYSVEAHEVSNVKYVGTRLKLHIKQFLELRELSRKHEEEVAEYDKFKVLQSRFG